MGDVVLFFLLFASPVLIVVAMARIGAMRRRILVGLTMITASLAPGAVIFLGTRQSDAITSAAAYFVAPMFCLYGLIAAVVMMAMYAAFDK